MTSEHQGNVMTEPYTELLAATSEGEGKGASVMARVKEPKRALQVGIIGCGRVADYHVRAIKAANTQLVGIADVNLESARRLARLHGVQKAYGSMEELLGTHQLDVVHIVTPPAYHYECAKTAIEHGASVLVEKPVVFTQPQAADLYDRAAKNQVFVCPDFILLFHPKMQKVLWLLESGRFGKVVHVDSHLRVDPGVLQSPDLREAPGLHWSYKLPGGVLHNYITHPLYMALHFTGPLNDLAVSGRSFGRLPQQLVDHLTIQIEGERCTASVLLSFHLQPATQDLRIYCEKGNVYINFDWQIVVVESHDSLPRIVNRALATYLQAGQLARESTSSLWRLARRKVVPYAGLHILTSRFYQSISQSAPPPISRELTMDVVKAEELIIQGAGKLHLDTHDRLSRQTNVRNSDRVLVTGGTGYVGFHVVKQLVNAGYYVRTMARPASRVERLETLGVEVMFGDVRCVEDVKRAGEGMDLIVHLAAAISGRPDFMIEAAVQGTRNIASVAAQQQIKRVIYVSSMSVYNFHKLRNGDRITEDSPLEDKPELRGAYTLAKRNAEDVALAHLKEQSPSWTILRPSVVVGKGRDLASQVGKQIGSTLICLSSPRNELRIIHVEEVAAAIVELLRSENAQGQIFNLSHDSVSVRQYVDACVQPGQPGRLRVIYVPYFVAWLVSKTFGVLKKVTGRGFGFNQHQLSYMYRNVGADSSHLSRQIGWQPRIKILPTLAAESISRR
jgi:2-alkyl-3-oxoalkanoate reductase